MECLLLGASLKGRCGDRPHAPFVVYALMLRSGRRRAIGEITDSAGRNPWNPRGAPAWQGSKEMRDAEIDRARSAARRNAGVGAVAVGRAVAGAALVLQACEAGVELRA